MDKQWHNEEALPPAAEHVRKQCILQPHLLCRRQAPDVHVGSVSRQQHDATVDSAAGSAGDGSLRDAADACGVVLHEGIAAVRQQLRVVASLRSWSSPSLID